MPEKPEAWGDRSLTMGHGRTTPLIAGRTTPLTPRTPELPRAASAAGRAAEVPRAASAFGRTGMMDSFEASKRNSTSMSMRDAALDSKELSIKKGAQHSEWVQTSVIKFERDATNHWTKWGCGGKHLAQELWHVADELQQLCAKDGGQWFPDMRMQRLHEQLLFIVHGLSQQPPRMAQLTTMEHTAALQLPTITPRTPQSVTKIENARLRKDLTDANAKIDAMENTFATYMRTRDKVKARDSWLINYGLSGRVLTYETAAVKNCFGAWAKHVQIASRGRHCKRVAARAIENTQEEHDVAILARCIGLWAAHHRVTEARSGVSDTLGVWYERQNKADVEQQYGLSFHVWRRETKMERAQIEVTRANLRTAKAIETARLHTEKLLKRFGDMALATLKKMIGSDHVHCLLQAFQDWQAYLVARAAELEEMRRLREAKELLEDAERKERERKMALTERSFGRSASHLMGTCVIGWRQEVMEGKLAAKIAEEGMSEATRRILAIGETLRRICFVDWNQWIKKDQAARKIREMEMKEEIVALARQRAINMLSKNSQGMPPETLLSSSVEAWQEQMYHARLHQRSKQIGLSTSLRRVSEKDHALTCMSVGAWANLSWMHKNRVREKLEWEKDTRRKFLALKDGAVLRLHKRLAITQIFHEWCSRAEVRSNAKHIQ